MRLRPTPPPLPPDLLDQFGEPEHVFGPNMRFRIISAIVGTLVILLGIVFFACWIWAMEAPRLPGAGLYLCLSAGLMLVGAVSVVFPWRMPLGWVFVCRGGLVRVLGQNWEGVAWADVVRFDDTTMSGMTVTTRQCRIITSAGTEWGFMANWVADYTRLVEVLRERVAR